MGTAAIWIPPSIYGSALSPSFDGLRSIAISLLSFPLDDFLFNKLPLVLSQKREEVKWHLNPLCRGCTYERSCTERAVRDGELGSMANISIQDAEVLKTVLSVSGRQDSVSDIRGFVTEADRDEFTRRLPSARVFELSAGHNIHEELPADLARTIAGVWRVDDDR